MPWHLGENLFIALWQERSNIKVLTKHVSFLENDQNLIKKPEQELLFLWWNFIKQELHKTKPTISYRAWTQLPMLIPTKG